MAKGCSASPAPWPPRRTKGYPTVTPRSPFIPSSAAWDREAAARPRRGRQPAPRHRRERFMSSRLTRIASVTGIAGLALTALAATAPAAAAAGAGDSAPTTTPIKHVIVIIGENHTFDNVFATYQPPAGQTIWNLRSEGIVTANGTPGPNFSKATQLTASNTKTYTADPEDHRHLQDASPAQHDLRRDRLRRPAGQQPRHPVPRDAARRAVPDHQVRALQRRPLPVHRRLRVQRRLHR